MVFTNPKHGSFITVNESTFQKQQQQSHTNTHTHWHSHTWAGLFDHSTPTDTVIVWESDNSTICDQ